MKAGSADGWAVSPALEYQINWEIFTPYVDEDVMLLHINGKFTMGILK